MSGSGTTVVADGFFSEFILATVDGEVIFLGKAGLCTTGVECVCKLLDDVVDLKAGVLGAPIFASSATLSLAKAASDLLLLLVVKPDDEDECLWPCGLGGLIAGRERGRPGGCSNIGRCAVEVMEVTHKIRELGMTAVIWLW